ncbi:unnamed protein product [Peniophora sp. CBMAI 1063]|nr:unnamed protein product [Peniophora sp. CBMAI 1063]
MPLYLSWKTQPWMPPGTVVNGDADPRGRSPQGSLCTAAVRVPLKPAPEIESSGAIDNVKAKILHNECRIDHLGATYVVVVHILVNPTPDIDSSNAIDHMTAKSQDNDSVLGRILITSTLLLCTSSASPRPDVVL